LTTYEINIQDVLHFTLKFTTCWV